MLQNDGLWREEAGTYSSAGRLYFYSALDICCMVEYDRKLGAMEKKQKFQQKKKFEDLSSLELAFKGRCLRSFIWNWKANICADAVSMKLT